MKSFKLSFLFVFLLLSATDSEAYYGRRSTEAELTFAAVADIPFSGSTPAAAKLNREGKVRARAMEQVDLQIQHLMGTFQSESFREAFGFAGVLGENYSVKFTKVEPGSEPGRLRLSYDFNSRVVFDKRAFENNGTRAVPLRLPLSPDRIYELGVVDGENLCTDHHYNSEGDFWYFWDSELQGCPLSGDQENVLQIRGHLKRIANTRGSYPEYDRLYGDNGNGEVLEIAAFIGYIGDVVDLKNPDRKDEAFAALKHVDQDLKSRGFSRVEKVDAFREYRDGRRVKGINYLRVYESRMTALGKDVTVRVRVLLADTAVSSRDVTFHRYLVPAFQDSDVVLYDGHSGLGGNLDLDSLPEIKFDRKKYQIFFFNGCSTYPYFNGMFFEAKGGSRNLEVVTSGLPTFSNTAGPNIIAFMDRFLRGETYSYQTILSELEDSNGEEGTYLTGVNGDEDNRWKKK